jgi:hypothetical protein
MLTIQRILVIVSIVLFLAAGIGFSQLKVGTVELSLIGFGLACFAGSHL